MKRGGGGQPSPCGHERRAHVSTPYGYTGCGWGSCRCARYTPAEATGAPSGDGERGAQDYEELKEAFREAACNSARAARHREETGQEWAARAEYLALRVRDAERDMDACVAALRAPSPESPEPTDDE